jgi:uncharacterized membrane protein
MKTTTQEERTLAALGHGLTFVDGGILLPFVLYLLQKDKSQFVAFHCLQSIYFGLLAAVVLVIFGLPLYVLTCGLGMILFLPLAVAYFVWEIVSIVKAYNGEWYMLPIVGRWAYETHNPDKMLPTGTTPPGMAPPPP